MIKIKHVHLHVDAEVVLPLLSLLNSIKAEIMSTKEELRAKLVELSGKLTKVYDEIVASTVRLEAAIVAAGNTSPEVDAALVDLTAKTDALDALNTDVIVEPPIE